jgi:hypothetical protein
MLHRLDSATDDEFIKATGLTQELYMRLNSREEDIVA